MIRASVRASVRVLTAIVMLTLPLGAQSRLEIRAGGLAQLGARNTLIATDVNAATGTMLGSELLARVGRIGVRIRLGGGTFTDSSGTTIGDLAGADLGVQFGNAQLVVEGGISRRALAGPRGTVIATAFRPGAIFQIPIGETGLALRIAPALFVAAGASEPKMSGLDLETGLVWTPPQWPIYAQLGYRYEQFTMTSGGTDRPEEMGSVIIGGGVRWRR